MSNQTIKAKVKFYLVDCTTVPGKAIDIALIILNILTCLLYAVGTYIENEASFLSKSITVLEGICLTIFIIEYILRFWVAEKKLRHFFSLYALIDLISILPVLSTVLDLRFLRAARIFRIFRFFRFFENEEFFFGRITQTQIKIARLLMTALAIIFVASGCIYEAEEAVNPQFGSLGDAAYFAIVTVTTVGFGDQTPATDIGRIITALMIIAGVICIPYHIGQIARQVFFDASLKEITCKSCGLARHEQDAKFCRLCGEELAEEERKV
ncbi:MAG: potassium channel family protein [Planctomycetota bacterium]|jgi:voltage-gated potassium channel